MNAMPRPMLACFACALMLSSGCRSGEQTAKSAQGSVAQAQQESARNPCSLLTRVEVEGIVGPLAAAPFRSREDTAAVDPEGTTCVYRVAPGRALLLTAEWADGQMIADAERLVGGLVRQVVDLPGVAADTLEGPWDEAIVGMREEMIFRKGARALTMHYSTVTDASGALRLAVPAVARLAAFKAPARPDVPADGCPLVPERVSNIVGMTVRLAPRPVRLIDRCSYQLVRDPTVEVELEILPEESADLVFEGLRSRAAALSSVGATMDSVTIGSSEEGWSYGSTFQSEAAALAGGRVFHARMTYTRGMATPRLRVAMIQLVAAMM